MHDARPFLGTWELVPDLSRYESGPPPKSGIYRIEAADDTAAHGADIVVTTDDYADFETAEMLADESFDQAFTSFMGNDLGAEPSRDWMINGE